MNEERTSKDVLRKCGVTICITAILLGLIIIYVNDRLILNLFNKMEWLYVGRDTAAYFISRAIGIAFVIVCAYKAGILKDIKYFSNKSYLALGYLGFMFFMSLARIFWVVGNNIFVPFSWKICSLLLLYTIGIGFFEEIWFRGFIYGVLRVKFEKLSPTACIIIQGVLFGLSHFSNYIMNESRTLSGVMIQMFNATILGIIFGFAYEKTQSLFACSITHAFWDFAIMFIKVFKHKVNYVDVPSDVMFYIALFSFLLYLICKVFLKNEDEKEEKERIEEEKRKKYELEFVDIDELLGDETID